MQKLRPTLFNILFKNMHRVILSTVESKIEIGIYSNVILDSFMARLRQTQIILFNIRKKWPQSPNQFP